MLEYQIILSSFKKNNFLFSPKTLSAAPYKQERKLLLPCFLVRKAVERAHTRVQAISENWSGISCCRKVTGELVVSVGQTQAQLWRSHNVRCLFNKIDLIKKSLWYNFFETNLLNYVTIICYNFFWLSVFIRSTL